MGGESGAGGGERATIHQRGLGLRLVVPGFLPEVLVNPFRNKRFSYEAELINFFTKHDVYSVLFLTGKDEMGLIFSCLSIICCSMSYNVTRWSS